MNPYQVLGVSPSADKEEIRAAYMALVKKYHPDRYQDSALKAQAEEKMKQINAAYDMLTKEPIQGNTSSYGGGSYGGAYGGSSYGGSSYGGSTYGGSYSGSYSGSSGSASSADYARIRSLINAGRVTEAEALLNARPRGDAEWYFLYGMCAYRRGRYATAYEYISRACSMAPNNAEYRSVLSSLRGSSGTRSSTPLDQTGYCGVCGAMICANLLCGMCCR